MKNRFLAIDVETANENLSSICQIGIATFEEGELIDRYVSLVNPETYFSTINVEIHGITKKDVIDAPTKQQISEEMKTRLSGEYVVSYSLFDKNSIGQSFGSIDYLEWIDAMRLVRRGWEEFAFKGYGLKNVSSFLGIKNTNHHDAINDAVVCGKIFIAALDKLGVGVNEAGAISKKKLSSFHYDEHADELTANPDGILFGEVVAFTGEMSLPRTHLKSMASEAGCEIKNNLTKTTTLLVCGIQDPNKIKGELSRKEAKALALISQGHALKMISENDFMSMIALD